MLQFGTAKPNCMSIQTRSLTLPDLVTHLPCTSPTYVGDGLVMAAATAVLESRPLLLLLPCHTTQYFATPSSINPQDGSITACTHINTAVVMSTMLAVKAGGPICQGSGAAAQAGVGELA